MFYPDSRQRIWLYTQPTDMRKSFNGLIGITQGQLKANAQNGDWFVFVNRRKTHLKVLYFDGTGFCIWFKRLEQGQFNFHPFSEDKKSLDFAGTTIICGYRSAKISAIQAIFSSFIIRLDLVKWLHVKCCKVFCENA